MTGATATGAVPPARDRLPDEAYERMALVLRVGLVASLAIFLGAIGTYLALHPRAGWSSSEANPSGGFLNLPGLASGLAGGSPVAFLTLAVLLLVATPLVRVLSGLYYFQRGGERALAGIALTVFVLLLFGLLVLGPWVR
ncbi:MAG: DUF1634 domain-containing protein [Thermoplasmata archaeon]